MAAIMLALGGYRFSLPTAPYQELERIANWRWPSQDLLLQFPARQFVGPGDVTIALQGVVMPHYRALLGASNIISRVPSIIGALGGVERALSALQAANLGGAAGAGSSAVNTPGYWQLDALKQDADRGVPLLMIDGRGRDWGYWCVERIGEVETFHLDNGAYCRCAFDINLSFYGHEASRGVQSALAGVIADLVGFVGSVI